jgi:acetyl-CoA carboxylase biotin carboxylase subunit
VRIAAGLPLTLSQEDVQWNGSAVECRICAEDPDRDFLPSPGRITQLDRPAGPGIRIDSGVYAGWSVPLEYDPLLAKIVAWAGSREGAVSRMVAALSEYYVAGIKTNLSFFRQILQDPEFREGRLHTGFIAEYQRRTKAREESGCGEADRQAVAALVAAIHAAKSPASAPSAASPQSAAWLRRGRQRLLE